MTPSTFPEPLVSVPSSSFFIFTYRYGVDLHTSFGSNHFPMCLLTSNFNKSVFFIFNRSSIQFLGSSQTPTPSAVPVITCFGCVIPIAVVDSVLSLENVRYRLQKLFPADGTVVLQKSHTRSLFRAIYQPTAGAPKLHQRRRCFCWIGDCKLPVPGARTSSTFTRPYWFCHTSWLPCRASCGWLVFTQGRLIFVWSTATLIWWDQDRSPNFFDLNLQLLADLFESQWTAEQELDSLRAQHVALTDGNKKLRVSSADPKATHNELMPHSLAHTKQICDLRSRLPEKQPPPYLYYEHFSQPLPLIYQTMTHLTTRCIISFLLIILLTLLALVGMRTPLSVNFTLTETPTRKILRPRLQLNWSPWSVTLNASLPILFSAWPLTIATCLAFAVSSTTLTAV